VTTVTSADSTFVPIQAHSLIAGVSARVTDTLRFRFDTELYYADNAFTRISPRHLQRYRLRTTYKPVDWVNLSGGISILENRNTALDIGNLQHNRSYSIAAELAPHEGKWGVDLSYDYNDIFSQTNNMLCRDAQSSGRAEPRRAIPIGDFFLRGEIAFWVGVRFCAANAKADSHTGLYSDQLGR
jgi:outer membrane receptor protein involved in Fe transport